MRYVQVKKGVAGFLVGDRFVTREDGPFAIDDDRRAGALIQAGLVEGCLAPEAMPPAEVYQALYPSQVRVEKAVRKR